jgi:lipopolysaccharide transport system ATP-binding protein
METAIKVENLGKLYRLGELGTGTLSHDLNRWFAKIRGKEDPFAKVGEINDRTTKGNSDFIWALKDVGFDVKQGEVLGIIGRNGAGKSTLLKLLSKVTTPSTGRIKIRGRIASLLEVGTGFHAELTGRENIFLNGAILGMTKIEIKSKFDEIVNFAGVERYVDTPVKRYSSGMYVRLAFAVAAFLEPEILIVDEVLAVGDTEFQKKCLGRMKDVSRNDGRTVLFVSHNMAAVESLCNRAINLMNGSIVFNGSTMEAIQHYNKSLAHLSDTALSLRTDRTGNKEVFFNDYKIISQPQTGSDLIVEFEILAKDNFDSASFAMVVRDQNNYILTTCFTKHSDKTISVKKGSNTLRCTVPELPLAYGTYIIDLWCSSGGDANSDYLREAFSIDVSQGNFYKNGYLPNPVLHGSVYIKNYWE